MSDILTQSPVAEADQETLVNQMFGEIQRLNALMQEDQSAIERLKAETRMISAHSDQLLLQIEAQLNTLRKAV